MVTILLKNPGEESTKKEALVLLYSTERAVLKAILALNSALINHTWAEDENLPERMTLSKQLTRLLLLLYERSAYLTRKNSTQGWR